MLMKNTKKIPKFISGKIMSFGAAKGHFISNMGYL